MDCMCLELIWLGGESLQYVVDLEFELIYIYPLAFKFSLNFHVNNAKN